MFIFISSTAAVNHNCAENSPNSMKLQSSLKISQKGYNIVCRREGRLLLQRLCA